MSPKEIINSINEEEKKSIYSLLTKLKSLGEAFNQMGGDLYSAIIADEMTGVNKMLYTKYGVNVEFVQPVPGRVKWINLDQLIEEYKVEDAA